MLQPKKSTFLQDLKKHEDQLIKDGKIDDPKVLEEQLGGTPERVSSIDVLYPNKSPEEFENFEEYMPTQTVRSGQYSTEQLSNIRAENQSNWEQAGNASARFALNIVPSIVSGFASMLDVPGYFDAEHAATNDIVNAVEEWKQQVNQEIAPIYLENPDTPMDFGDFAWWMDRGEGLAESVASFLVQGMAMGAGVGALVKGAGALANASKLTKLVGMGAKTQKTIGHYAGTLTNAIALNQSEAVLEATSVYNDTKNYWLDKGYSMEDAKKQAAIGASTTMNMNRANILLNITSAHMFMTPMKLARKLVDPVSRANTLKSLVAEGSQEALEELINHSASQAGKAHGKGEEYGFNDAIKDMKSAEGIEAALLGAFGGIAQTGGAIGFKHSKYGTGSAVNKETGKRESAYTQQTNRYEKQQKIIEDLKVSGVKSFDVLNNLAYTMKLGQEMADAQNNNDIDKYNQLQAELFETKALTAFQSGTTQILEDLIKSSAGEDGETGISKEQVNEAISNLRELEAVYNNYENFENVEDLFFNRANKIRTERILRSQKANQIDSKMNLQATAEQIAKKYKFKVDKEVVYKKEGVQTGTETRTTEQPITFSLENLGDNPGTTEDNRKVYDAFVEELSNTEVYKNAQEQDLTVEETENLLNSLNEQFVSIKSKEGQEKAKQEKAEKAIESERMSKILRDDFEDLDELRKMASETKDENVRRNAEKKIKTIETNRAIEAQQKKDDTVFNKYSTAIAKTDSSPEGKAEFEKLKAEIGKLKNLSPALKQRLADSIDARQRNMDAGMMSDEKVTKPDPSDENTVDLSELITNSQLPKDFVTDDAEENIAAEIADAVKEVYEKDRKPQLNEKGDLEYDYDRSEQGHDKAAFLARDFVQKEFDGKVTREDIDNELNEVNPDILNPNALNEGTKITIKVDDDYDGDVYVGDTKEKMPWSERKKQISNNPDTMRDEIPMVVVDNTGKKLFHIHDVNWINETNVYGDIESDRDALRAIRDKVLASGTSGVETSITGKTAGILFTTAKGESVLLKDGMPDPNLQLVIGKDNAFTDPSVDRESLLNKKIRDGQLYAIIPVGKEKIAIPLQRTQLKNNPEIYNTIVKAIEAYLDPENNQEFIENVAKVGSKLDVSELSNLSKFISQFIYLYPLQGNESLVDVVSRSSEKFNRQNGVISITGNSIEFGKPGISNSWGSISLNTPANMLPALLKRLKYVLSDVKTHAKKDNNKVITTDVAVVNADGQVVSKPYRQFIGENFKSNVLSTKINTKDGVKYVYSIQQNITFDTSFAPVQKKPVVATTTQSTTTQVADIERKTTKVISSEIVEKGIKKGQTITVTQTNSIEDLEGIVLSVTEYAAKVGDTEVTIGGRTMTFKEFKEEFPLEEDWVEILNGFEDLNDDTKITVRKVRRTPSSSRFETVVSIFSPLLGGKMDVAIKQDDTKYDAELAALEGATTTDTKEDIESEIVDNALKQELDNASQSVANDTQTHPTENLIDALKVLKSGKVTEELGQKEVDAKIYVFENALRIRKDNNEANNTTDLSELINKDRKIQLDSDESSDDTDFQLIPEIDVKDAVGKALSEMMIKGLSPRQQSSLIGYIGSKIIKASIDKLQETGKSKISVNEIFDEVENDLKKDYQLYIDNILPNKASKVKGILDDFAKVKQLTIAKIELMNTGTLTLKENNNAAEIESDDITTSVLSDEEMDMSDEASGGLENVLHSDDWTFTLDSKSTASANLKKFLTFVEDKEDGLTKFNDLGFPEIIEFDVVYNTLHELLAGLPANYDKMIATLEASTDKFPWLQTVIERLDDTSDQIRNEFVSDMAKHAITMKFILWNKLPNGKYVMFSKDANSASTQKRLLTTWNYNITDGNNPYSILKVDENGTYVYDRTKIEPLVALAKEWENATVDNLPTNDELLKWLNAFGITIGEETLNELRLGKFKNKGTLTFQRLFTAHNGLVKVLATQIDKYSEKTKFDDTKIINDTVIQSLATMEASNAENIFSNSFNAGGKTIYTFSNNKYVINRFRDLKEDAQLRADLENVPFIKGSLWLNELNNNPAFNEHFGIDYLSLEALKKEFTPSKDNRKLNNLTEDEHEVIKLAMFFNNYNNRQVSFFYPTMSDKTTMMVVNALARKIEVNDDFELRDDKVVELYDVIVMPEIQRMLVNRERNKFRNANNKTRNKALSKAESIENNAGYKPDFFYFVPSLNETKVTINGKEKTIVEHVLSSNGEITKELRDVILDELKSTFQQLTEDKIDEWVGLGVGVNNAFLNSPYMDNIAEGLNKPKADDKVSQKVRYAATDYVFNYLIANAEMFKVSIGDPALYAKFKDGNTVKQNLESTFGNIGKRLAGDIAPGIELADSEKNEYYQIFMNDTTTQSKAYLNEIFDKVSENTKKEYGKIKGSDAQEYTTWQEHLYVLNKLGRISKKQHADFSDKIRKGEELSFSELSLVLQPMKPVYVGNRLEKLADRRIYIKSSSFPLLPQLTKGLQIDKLRVQMEQFERSKNSTVRASFNTANKVGSVVQALDVFDVDGKVLDINITDANVLKLQRKNFRIQQDVPYDHEKSAVNIGTQERKLLFNNILSISNFDYVGKKLTGAELKSKYDDLYKKMFEYKRTLLEKELGLLEDISEEINPKDFLSIPESSTFTALEEMEKASEGIKSPVAKSKLKNELQDKIGTKQFARAQYVNKNFDKIIEKLMNAKVNVFFDENIDKKCE